MSSRLNFAPGGFSTAVEVPGTLEPGFTESYKNGIYFREAMGNNSLRRIYSRRPLDVHASANLSKIFGHFLRRFLQRNGGRYVDKINKYIFLRIFVKQRILFKTMK